MSFIRSKGAEDGRFGFFDGNNGRIYVSVGWRNGALDCCCEDKPSKVELEKMCKIHNTYPVKEKRPMERQFT